MLLPGDWVEVLPHTRIIEELDERCSVEGLPFMPEMLPYCGRRYRVALRAERTCVHPPERPLRRLENCLVLEGLRCDGSSHGGCQLGCALFWKEAWVRRVDGPAPTDRSELVAPLPSLPTRTVPDGSLYFCQGTQLVNATKPGEPLWKPGQYARFLATRTFTLAEIIGMFGRPLLRRIWRSVAWRTRRPPSRPAALGLAPGEWVRVKTRQGIAETLDDDGTYRGLGFGGDMYAYCGRRMRVEKRVDRIIDEATGRIRSVRDTVMLEGSVCEKYLGCARGMPILWREAWLERVNAPTDL